MAEITRASGTTCLIQDDRAILSDVSSILWNEPRKWVELQLPSPTKTGRIGETPNAPYIIGMEKEENAFICGLIRERNPKKILEVGVNRGGSTIVLLKALDLLDSSATLYSADILENLPAKDTLRSFPELTGRLELKHGRDVSAYLEEIGRGIDFCILDTAHFLPGEILNFLCIFPYLGPGATVIIHDQVFHFGLNDPYVRFLGVPSSISCRVLFDTVVADKLVPNFSLDGWPKAPNIASFTITEDTRKYISSVLSSLMLPWRFMPNRNYLGDVIKSLSLNYPRQYVNYFRHIVHRQMEYHLSQQECAAQYWAEVMGELKTKHGLCKVAFYGAGGYCRKLLETILPRDLWPSAIFDRNPCTDFPVPLPVHGKDKLINSGDVKVLVIVSEAHHMEIQDQLLSETGSAFEIINPFDPLRHLLG